MTKEERERRKRELATAAALLLFVRKANSLVHSTVRAIVRPAVARGLSKQQLRAVVENTTRATTLTVRRSARTAARTAWQTNTGLTATSSRTTLYEATSAQRAAASIGRQWASLVIDEEGDESAAIDGLVPKLLRTAETESVDAWNDETLILDGEAVTAGYVMAQSWSAILDRATCKSCSAMDGQTVTFPERFDNPPPLHPFCRCVLVSEVVAAGVEAA